MGSVAESPPARWPLPRRVSIALCGLLVVGMLSAEAARRAMLSGRQGRQGHQRSVAAGLPTSSPYRVEWGRLELPWSMSAGRQVRALITFRNGGGTTWADPATADPVRKAGKGAVRLGYRWWRGDSDELVTDYATRSDLGAPLRPGETVTLPIDLQVPQTPGRYRLQLDLVHEFVSWFEPRGADRLMVPVDVAPP